MSRVVYPNVIMTMNVLVASGVVPTIVDGNPVLRLAIFPMTRITDQVFLLKCSVPKKVHTKTYRAWNSKSRDESYKTHKYP